MKYQLKVGDTFVFGRYAPEDALDDGFKKLPITWQVLKEEDNRILVLSKKVLDLHPFHHDNSPLRWKDSDLCHWLNTVFLKSAFTDEEQNLICQVAADDDPLNELLWQMFEMESTTENISERIFLLSERDIKTYFSHDGLFSDSAAADAVENVPCLEQGDLCWWIRSSTAGWAYGVNVTSDASIRVNMINQVKYQGVRPAMWLWL